MMYPEKCYECGWDSQNPRFFYPYVIAQVDPKVTYYCSPCWEGLTGLHPLGILLRKEA